MNLLLKRGAIVHYNDPHIPALPPMRRYPHLRMDSEQLTADFVRSQDCVVVVTDHSAYDWSWIVAHAPLIVDTRNATRNVRSGADNVVLA
jgi:UDP-N-acetyl-D-glucosamine dehydrogenase